METEYFTDGGTTMFVLVDGKRHTLRGGFDGRIDYENRPGHAYVGGTYPTQRGARMLPLWGAEERALVRLLAEVCNERNPVPRRRWFLPRKK